VQKGTLIRRARVINIIIVTAIGLRPAAEPVGVVMAIINRASRRAVPTART